MCSAPLAYSKPFLSVNRQIERLKTRGMLIFNERKAKLWLKRVSYYRLSGYWYELRLSASTADSKERQDNFKPETSFDDVINLYLFDEKLRLLILQAIGAIEVALRACILNVLAEKNPYAYRDRTFFDAAFTVIQPGKIKSNYDEWFEKIELSVKRSKKEPFVEHFLNKYCTSGVPDSWKSMPLWIIGDCWDFGLLSKCYSGLNKSYSKKISKDFYLMSTPLLKSWLHTLNAARNFAAHHSRLWNRWWNVAVPKMPSPTDMSGLFSHIVYQYRTNPRIQKSTYMVLSIIKYFLIHTVEDKGRAWTAEIKNLLKQLPCVFGGSYKLGFPAGWERETLWTV